MVRLIYDLHIIVALVAFDDNLLFCACRWVGISKSISPNSSLTIKLKHLNQLSSQEVINWRGADAAQTEFESWRKLDRATPLPSKTRNKKSEQGSRAHLEAPRLQALNGKRNMKSQEKERSRIKKEKKRKEKKAVVRNIINFRLIPVFLDVCSLSSCFLAFSF